MRKRVLSYLTAILLCQVLLFQYVHAVPLTQVNSQYDVVFAVDNSMEMLSYDGLGDFSWMDAFVGVMEQVSDNSSFAVLTKDSTPEFGTLEETEPLLYEIPDYNGTANPVQLLQTAVAALDARETGNKKMVVLSVVSWYNKDELFGQITSARNQGIKVVLVAFAKEEQTIAEIQSADEEAIITLDVRDLSFNMGDLYAELVEEKESAVSEENAMVMNTNAGTNASPEYKTAFRISKHRYTFGNINRQESAGAYFSLLLNMYYLLPSYCTDISDSFNGYDMYDNGTYLSNTAHSIGKGDSSGMFAGNENSETIIDKVLGFWDSQVNIILSEENSNLYLSSSSINEMKSAIQENLKRRLPVFVQMGDSTKKNYLIVGQTTNEKYLMFDAMQDELTTATIDSFTADSNIKIIDTAQYFNMVRGTHYIADSSTENIVNGHKEKNISILLPESYQLMHRKQYDDEGNVQLDNNGNEIYDTNISKMVQFGNASVTIEELNGESSLLNFSATSYDPDFTVSVLVKYNGYIPNCYRSTLNYVITFYDDMTNPNVWYYDYAFDLTNLNIVHGEEDNDKDTDIVFFNADGSVKLIDFLTLLYCACDFEVIDGVESNVQTKIKEHVDSNQSFITKQEGEMIGFNSNITRQEAADLLWKAFQSDLCRVPHSLTEYSDFSQSPFSSTWNQLTDKNQIGDNYQFAIQQLFANGVMVGDNNKNMNPAGNLTRAEACVLISKSLFKLKELGQNINYFLIEDGYTQITSTYSANDLELNRYGGKNFLLEVSGDGIYKITSSSNVELYVETYRKEVLPIGGSGYVLKKASVPVLYVSGQSEDKFNLNITKTGFEISDIVYNKPLSSVANSPANVTARYGKNNTVELKVNKTTTDFDGEYEVSLCYADSETGIGTMTSEPQIVQLSSTTPTPVTFTNVNLNNRVVEGRFEPYENDKFYSYVEIKPMGSSEVIESNRVSNTIAGMMPQEIVFNKENPTEITDDTKKEFIILDDHPEHLREFDLLNGKQANGDEYAPMSLLHLDDLEEGKYMLFALHHRQTDGEGGIDIQKDVFYDVVFHGTGQVKVTNFAYGCRGMDNPSDEAWLHYYSYVWKTMLESVNSCEIDLSGGSPKFLSDTSLFQGITLHGDSRKLLKINGFDKGISNSYVHVLLEFEVVKEEGETVNLNTVAYSYQADSANESDSVAAAKIQSAKNKFNPVSGAGTESYYEDLQTIKGISENKQLIASDIMEYTISEEGYTEKFLPILMTNQLYPNGRVNGVFTTNSSPITINNHYSVPDTSIIKTEFDGKGVIRNSNGVTSLINLEEPWKFDTYHSRMVKNYILPKALRFGVYESNDINPKTLEPNALLDTNWLNRDLLQLEKIYRDTGTEIDPETDTDLDAALFTLDGLKAESLNKNHGVVTVNPGYGVTYEVNLRIHNRTNTVQKIDYLVMGGTKHVSWRSAISNSNTSWNDAWASESINSKSIIFSNEKTTERIFQDDDGTVYPRIIQPGECLNLQVWVTILTGSSATINHGVVVNATDNVAINLSAQTEFYNEW